MIINNIIFNNTNYWIKFVKARNILLNKINKKIKKKYKKLSFFIYLIKRNDISTIWINKKKKKYSNNKIKLKILKIKKYHNIFFKTRHIKKKEKINMEKINMEKIKNVHINNKYKKLLK